MIWLILIFIAGALLIKLGALSVLVTVLAVSDYNRKFYKVSFAVRP